MDAKTSGSQHDGDGSGWMPSTIKDKTLFRVNNVFLTHWNTAQIAQNSVNNHLNVQVTAKTSK